MDRLQAIIRGRRRTFVPAVMLAAVATGSVALRGAAQIRIPPNTPLVTDVASCPTTAVTIARTPFHVRYLTANVCAVRGA